MPRRQWIVCERPIRSVVKVRLKLSESYGGTKMNKFLNKFRKDEDGAVTVDWVVLTAAIVGLGLAVLSTVGDGTKILSEKV